MPCARHRGAAVALLGEQVGETVEWIDARFDQLAEVLAALAVIGELPREVLDRVQGLGEVFSAQLLAATCVPWAKTVRYSMHATCWWSGMANWVWMSTGSPARTAWPSGACGIRRCAWSPPVSLPVTAMTASPR